MIISSNKKHNIVWAALFLLFSFFALYIMLKSSVFEVRQVRIIVDGNILSSKDVELSHFIQISGIKTGENIFKLNLTEAEKKILALPEVKEVRITRKFPSTIIIDILQRKPVAMLLCGDYFMEIDIDGICLRKEQISKIYFPIITWKGYNNNIKTICANTNTGDRIEYKPVVIALQVIEDLPQELVDMLSEVHIADERIRIYTIDGIQGRLGRPLEIEQKGSVFFEILKEISEDKNIEYIDVKSLKTPAVKYRNGD